MLEYYEQRSTVKPKRVNVAIRDPRYWNHFENGGSAQNNLSNFRNQCSPSHQGFANIKNVDWCFQNDPISRKIHKDNHPSNHRPQNYNDDHSGTLGLNRFDIGASRSRFGVESQTHSRTDGRNAPSLSEIDREGSENIFSLYKKTGLSETERGKSRQSKTQGLRVRKKDSSNWIKNCSTMLVSDSEQDGFTGTQAEGSKLRTLKVGSMNGKFDNKRRVFQKSEKDLPGEVKKYKKKEYPKHISLDDGSVGGAFEKIPQKNVTTRYQKAPEIFMVEMDRGFLPEEYLRKDDTGENLVGNEVSFQTLPCATQIPARAVPVKPRSPKPKLRQMREIRLPRKLEPELVSEIPGAANSQEALGRLEKKSSEKWCSPPKGIKTSPENSEPITENKLPRKPSQNSQTKTLKSEPESDANFQHVSIIIPQSSDKSSHKNQIFDEIIYAHITNKNKTISPIQLPNTISQTLQIQIQPQLSVPPKSPETHPETPTPLTLPSEQSPTPEISASHHSIDRQSGQTPLLSHRQSSQRSLGDCTRTLEKFNSNGSSMVNFCLQDRKSDFDIVDNREELWFDARNDKYEKIDSDKGRCDMDQ